MPPAHDRSERLGQRQAGLLAHPQHDGYCCRHQSGVFDLGQLDQPDTILEPWRHAAGNFNRHPGPAQPPGLVTVTSRCRARRPATFADSGARPTKLVRLTGRLCVRAAGSRPAKASPTI